MRPARATQYPLGFVFIEKGIQSRVPLKHSYAFALSTVEHRWVGLFIEEQSLICYPVSSLCGWQSGSENDHQTNPGLAGLEGAACFL